ncbi:aspartate aminotransferase family protein [Flavisolibacter nicotianae]|uniref:aspartate aminotransferase family protein n=1 Tax=Flavisolibacter nicotianae TaxID=2364882 RepID=UPI000EB5798A|nr:aspartate aminotransferase family protein [Flavisolibacter nicotianae]
MPVENRYQKSSDLLRRSKNVLAGGVSSEFRKYNHPHALFYTHGCGSRIYDVDGNEYLDFTLSQGPLILGHSHPKVLAAISDYSEEGQLFAGQHIRELELAETIQRLIPSAERMRFCLDGSEAVQTALRIARAKTGRPKFLRFEGHYHGWLDNVAWGLSTPSPEALGSQEHPTVFPWSAGLADGAKDEFVILPWNDADLLAKTLAEQYHEIAAVITEPVMCNNGCIEPREGYLEEMRRLCDQYGITLIFDEVITGFRLGLSGAQGRFNITPDVSIFAKAIASGYPISAIVGKQEWMQLIEDGTVIHAGTMNSGNSSVAAALATINVLETENPYPRMYTLGNELMEGLRQLASEAGHNLLVQGPGPVFHTGFTNANSVNDFRDTLKYDKAKLNRFISGMHDRGIRIIGRGLWYISAAHTKDDISLALREAKAVLKTMI